MARKNLFTFSNISTAIFGLFLLLMLFSPEFKGTVIQGLMKVGLFQPDIPKTVNQENSLKQPAPGQEVTFTNEKGQVIQLSDLKGKVVFINFWATWCPPCIAEMPSINTLYEKYNDNPHMAFLMVDVDGKIDVSTQFMKKRKYTLPVYLPNSEIPEAYFSGSMPTTVILDKSGNIVFHHMGSADYGSPKVAEFLDKHLASPQ